MAVMARRNILCLILCQAVVLFVKPTSGFSVVGQITQTRTLDRRQQRLGGIVVSSANNDDNFNERTAESPIQILIDKFTSNPRRAISFSALMTLCGAALGPFLDSYHSLFGVLTYDTPLIFPITDLLTCVTTYWVPPLFGLAGFLIGWLYIWLDAVLENGVDGATMDAQPSLYPSATKVLIGISYFTFQYWLSGILFANQVDRAAIFILMSTLAGGGFYALDGTLSGLIVSCATALGGPLIEVGLMSTLPGSWAYGYNDPGETGFFPLWILPVYFLGGPANGNLARAFWNVLGDDDSSVGEEDELLLTSSIQKKIPCLECKETRAVPCPNCDGVGTYVTYGEQVICKACRGKGRVICRSCFSDYDDDPNDIANIRRIMDRIPD